MSRENAGLKVHCIVTGKQGYLGAELLKKKIDTFGSAESVASHYICRDAATLLRQGMSQNDVRKELGVTGEFEHIDETIIEESLGERRKHKDSSPFSNQPDASGEYWWQKADFKIKPGWDRQPLNVEEATKDACLRPDIHLDDVCERCPYFSRCKLPTRKINGKIPKEQKN